MNTKKKRFLKRVLSAVLVMALVLTSVQLTVYPSKDAKAASAESTMETAEILSATHVPDSNLRAFYTILANAQRLGTTSSLSGKTAGQIMSQYQNDKSYTDAVEGVYLTRYSGAIDFSGLTVKNIAGIGWARGATEMNLASLNSFTKVPDDEFAACTELTKIVLPSGVNEIGERSFQNCTSLVTLQIGGTEENVIDLTNVSKIGDSAFFRCSSIKAVNFKQADIKIGNSAFNGCSSISTLSIPVTTAANLGANAFEGCVGLQSVALHRDLSGPLNNAVFQSVGSGAKKVSFSIIGESAGKSRLPANITEIGEHCFSGAKLAPLDLSGCKITVIKQYGFSTTVFGYDLDEDYNLLLPSTLKTIEKLSFNSTGIITIKIPESCTNIEKSAFKKSTIYDITLPASLTKIKEETFSECELLDSDRIHIPNNAKLTEIEKKAFEKCINLSSTAFLKEQKNLSTIGEGAFSACYKVKREMNANGSEGSEVRDKYNDKYIYTGLEKVILPNCVEVLGDSVFADNYKLKTVNLGTGVVNIPDKAFYNSVSSAGSGASLDTVILSANLESVGDSAFENQPRLHTIGYTNGTTTTIETGKVQFGNKLRSIGAKAFSGCGVESSFSVTGAIVYVDPAKVYTTKTTGRSEFIIYSESDEECRTVYIDENNFEKAADLTADKKLEHKLVIVAKKLYLEEGSPTQEAGKIKISSYMVYDEERYPDRLYGTPNTPTEKYYTESEYSSQPASGKTAAYVVPTSSIINNYINSQTVALKYVFGLKDVVIPDSVRDDNLGESAFKDCIGLNEVTLSDNLTEIKNSTFYGAGKEVTDFINTGKKLYDYYGLNKINIPSELKVIGNNAFEKCYNLELSNKGVSTFGSKVQKIGNNAFKQCYSLDEVHFPTSLETIGNEAFAECAIKDTQAETEGTNPVYNYYKNLKPYGTKKEKQGLTVIDFLAATRLKEIGSGAFKQTNVENIALTKSKLVRIPDSLFEQCTYLKTITFNNDVESLGNKVLNDALYLSSVKIPANATLQKNTLCGVYGYNGLSFVRPSFSLETGVGADDIITVPFNSESGLKLPIRAFNSDTTNSGIGVSVKVGDGDYQYIYNENTGTDVVDEVNGISVEVDRENSPYSITLKGKERIKTPVSVKIEAQLSFTMANQEDSSHNFSQTLEYNVCVDDVPAKEVSVSAEGDNIVKNNPSMYEEKSGQKALYLPLTGSAASNGIKLTAQIEPKETTNDVSWVSSNENVARISKVEYVKGSGVTTAVVTPVEFGDAVITVKAGNVTDIINVSTQIPVKSISCSTSGTILESSLKGNSSSNPYSLSPGDTETISVTPVYSTDYSSDLLASYGEKVVFVSSDPEVVSVDINGKIVAKSTGKATITVQGQASATKMQFYFEVQDNASYTPSRVVISGASEVNMGGTVQLSAVVEPQKATQGVTWSVVSGDKCASIDANGVVTGIAKGEARIVATSTAKNTVKSEQYKITVKAPAKELRILNQDLSLEVGKSITISKTTKPEDTKGYYLSPADTTDTIEWRSSNEGVMTVTSNASSVTLKAVSVGTADIIGTTSSGLSTSASVSVFQKANSITVDKEVTLNVGGTYKLNPQKVPAESNENLTYTFTSSNVKIATVDESGMIRAIAPGSASISVKSDTGKSASCTVTVKQPAKSITLLLNRPSTKTIYLAKGQSATLNTKVLPENTTDKLTYKSSKAKVATVSTSGQVTAKSKGSASITIKADSGKKITVKVVVSKKPVKAKKVKIKCKASMKRKKTMKLSVSLKPAKSTDTLSFSSNKSDVATVDAYGYVTAKKKGKVKITVTASSGKKATKTIKVK